MRSHFESKIFFLPFAFPSCYNGIQYLDVALVVQNLAIICRKGENKMSNTKDLPKRNTEETSVEVENTLPFRLAYAIVMRNTSQAELAAACGMAPSNIYQYIGNKTIPQIDTVKLLAEKLQVSETWLMGAGKATDINNRDPIDLSSEEQRLLENYRKLDERGKDFVIRLVETAALMNKNQKLM